MTLYIAVIGTSDQSCWLAEACKIFLLLFFLFFGNGASKLGLLLAASIVDVKE